MESKKLSPEWVASMLRTIDAKLDRLLKKQEPVAATRKKSTEDDSDFGERVVSLEGNQYTIERYCKRCGSKVIDETKHSCLKSIEEQRQ